MDGRSIHFLNEDKVISQYKFPKLREQVIQMAESHYGCKTTISIAKLNRDLNAGISCVNDFIINGN